MSSPQRGEASRLLPFAAPLSPAPARPASLAARPSLVSPASFAGEADTLPAPACAHAASRQKAAASGGTISKPYLQTAQTTLLVGLLFLSYTTISFADQENLFHFSVEYNTAQKVETKIYLDGKLINEYRKKIWIMPALGGEFTLPLAEQGKHVLKVVDDSLGINWEKRVELKNDEPYCGFFIDPEKRTVGFGCQKEPISYE